MKILDYFVLVLLISVMMILSSCSKDELYDDVLIPTLKLDGRLPMDSNGYYHLTLNQSTNQTIHRVSGVVGYTEYWDEPLKVSWDSNLTWIYQGEDVSTSNQSSYVSDDGEINTVIAPIFSMKSDTLRVECKVNEWNIRQTLNIVLD